MKVVILAGGYGSRIAEETEFRPKPMIEIGGMPILWHIMKEYSYYGHNDFIICAGYKQEMIKEWFNNYYMRYSDVTFDLANNNAITYHNKPNESWRVTIVDTGLDTMTATRIKKVEKYIGEESFLLTYGDGVCDVDINKTIDFHHKQNKIATITAVKKPQDKGILEITQELTVKAFREKSVKDSALISAGYMVLEPSIFKYIDDNTSLELDVLPKLANDNELVSYVHEGYWQCMDTNREKIELESLLNQGKAPWVKW